MRKSEKLFQAIGEISDDLVEEAYTYEPKHGNHIFKWRTIAAVIVVFLLVGAGVSVGGGTSFFQIGNILSKFGEKDTQVYLIQEIPVTQQEIQAGVALRMENGETAEKAKKEVIKEIITKKTLYAAATKQGFTVSDQEYDAYVEQLREQLQKAENQHDMQDFYEGFGGENNYWKSMEASIRQNLVVRKYIDSQTGKQTEKEIRQKAYESGVKQIDLEAFEQVVDETCKEMTD